MANSDYEILISSFVEFASKADRFLHLKNEEDYLETLDLIEELMDNAEDSEDDPRNDLIEVLANSVTVYESNCLKLSHFEQDIREIDSAISTLRLLIDQYSLSSSDLKEEIGSKSLVSMILSGKRSLTKDHIYRLSERFNLDPSVFFPKRSNKSLQPTAQPAGTGWAPSAASGRSGGG
jgi:HTH-type transcriptional regulator/antitoxin HigA